MNDHQKAFLLSIILCCVSDLRKNEPVTTQKSAVRAKKLRRMEGDIVKISNLYLPPDGFAYDDMQKADLIVDLVNAKIGEIYPDEGVEPPQI